ncbi:MAG: hypothetical protein KGL39_14510 [Patescibacteria group bacterium]|nr:hypothetical protein [Patescibacteria group bacterium]
MKKKENAGHITAYGRRHLSKSEFALPPKEDEAARGQKGSYPIDTIGRARAALSRVSQFGTPEEQAEVRRRVHEKYPQIALNKRR